MINSEDLLPIDNDQILNEEIKNEKALGEYVNAVEMLKGEEF